MLTRILKLLRGILYKIGIDIKFVRKSTIDCAWDHNSLEARDNFYKHSKNVSKYLEKRRLDFFKKIINIVENNDVEIDYKNIADFGCGTGMLFHFINQRFENNNFYGYDFSSEAINLSKSNFPKGNFETHDIYKPLEKKFDIIFCTEVLEHLADPEIALRNLIGMLNENSIIFISVPDGRIDNYEGHINFWSPESWDIFINKQTKTLHYKTGRINETNLYALIFK